MGKRWDIRCWRWRLHGYRPSGRAPGVEQLLQVRRSNLEFLLLCRPYIGIQVIAKRNLFTSDGPGGKWEVHYERCEVKKKAAPSSGDGARHLAALETNYLVQHLPLVEHLAVTAYDDGEPRVPGFITIRTQGAAWTLDVKDPDSGLSFRVVDQSLDKALDTAALLLGCDQAPWAPDPFLSRQNGKKKK